MLKKSKLYSQIIENYAEKFKNSLAVLEQAESD